MNLKKIIITCFAIVGLGMLTSCGTIHGFGKDVSTAGREIQQASR